MRVAMIGQKGVPALHGGVERHVEELAARLVELGNEVVVFTRPNYTNPELTSHRGITLKSLATLGTKHLDAIVHSALATVWAIFGRFDILHYHAVGPALLIPLARLAGRRTVCTIHGQDWRRGKWGRFASLVLRAGEYVALSAPDATISVSESLANQYRETYGREVHYIPNGVTICDEDDLSVLSDLSLEPGGYILFAGRLVPEKGAHYLAEAWSRIGKPMPLVIAGDTSFSGSYVDDLRGTAPNAVFPGYVLGARLATLFRNAALFVLPSDLEGLPIVLLEALAYGVPVLSSDIPPAREILGDRGEYFTAGDVESLTSSLRELLSDLPARRHRSTELRVHAISEYDWNQVAASTNELYQRVLSSRDTMP